MRKLINKAHVAIETLKFFTLNQWSWTNANLNKLQSALVNTDDNESLESFSFDISSLDWKIFNDNYVLGVRHYVLKNHPDSMDSSRKKLKILYFLHRFIQLAFVFFLIYNIMLAAPFSSCAMFLVLGMYNFDVLEKQAQKGFRPPSAMKGIGYFQNLRKKFGEILWEELLSRN